MICRRFRDGKARRDRASIVEIGEQRSELIGVRCVGITLPGRSCVGLTTEKTRGLKIGKKSVESHLRVAR